MRYFVLFFIPIVTFAQPKNFAEAKRLARQVYFDNKTELYCGCSYYKKTVDLASCGYIPRKNQQRAERIEWEHVVPAATFGRQLQCWQKGKRKGCIKNDPNYNLIEADLHNLIPVIGEINQDRNDFQYAILNERPTQYGQCQTVVDFKQRKMMPRREVRGIVARISLYMYDKYHLKLSKQDRQLFNAWNKAYPVTDWERTRNQRTACIMGWGNDYVSQVDMGLCN